MDKKVKFLKIYDIKSFINNQYYGDLYGKFYSKNYFEFFQFVLLIIKVLKL